VAEGNGEALGWLNELVESVRRIHADILETSGGLAGEHEGKLYGAVARPFHMAFGQFVFPSSYSRCAALFHGIIAGHVFVDGNKRTASMLCASMIEALEDDVSEPSSLQMRMLGELAVHTAQGGVSVDDVAFWIERIFAPRGSA